MSDQIVNTKIERVTEAVEALTIAVTAALTAPQSNFDDVIAARAELKEALGEFLQPTLRVVRTPPFTLQSDSPAQKA